MFGDDKNQIGRKIISLNVSLVHVCMCVCVLEREWVCVSVCVFGYAYGWVLVCVCVCVFMCDTHLVILQLFETQPKKIISAWQKIGSI